MASRMGLGRHGDLAVLELEVARCALPAPDGLVLVPEEGMACRQAAVDGPAQQCIAAAAAHGLRAAAADLLVEGMRAADVSSSRVPGSSRIPFPISVETGQQVLPSMYYSYFIYS